MPQLRHNRFPEVDRFGATACFDGPRFCEAMMTVSAGNYQETTVEGAVNLRWYVVNTLPHREFKAKRQLENQGFRVFFPQRLKTVRHARKFSNVKAPFFPRYIFVELDLSVHRWRSVNGTFGVSSLVMQGDQPHPVPQGIVETMIASVDEKDILRFERTLQKGSEVRLIAGPFAEQLGILDRLDDSGRIHVLLNIMGGTIRVHVPRDYAIAA